MLATNYRLPISLHLSYIHKIDIDMAHAVRDDRHPMEETEGTVWVTRSFGKKRQANGQKDRNKKIDTKREKESIIGKRNL